MFNDTKSSPTLWAYVQNAAFWVLQIVDIRLALVIGLAAFMLAVGFDSSGNQAEAADLVTGPSLVPVSVSGAAAPSYGFEEQPLSSNPQLATARRLRHGSLTSAIMTSNRLTGAHFFTDLPLEQK
ncbi:hypothetical protein [Phormidium tenue]|uniref:Uncharacterized protein n=1 Tax=Phormidium tenue NIES-30 TaxID=549789 RepID=A0A1U7J316_9CYAN|nr:hypothetical protein [Phormidium tenue]MBD2233222.1 hypothetical protein [Phormidium tenue FACHB-1052]OKH46600.1 hypothetical protein NIES30_16010 [Phormidium tenue NIES-30]